VGEKFDPHLHEAVEVEEIDDGNDGIVLTEFVKGYKSHTRTIRPARVKVAKKKIIQQENETI
jgi:molecular chaperone GrpE